MALRRRVRVGAKARARIRNGGPTSVHRAALPRDEYQALKAYIYKRDGWRCRACTKRGSQYDLDVHHVVKRSRGGADDPSNLIALCRWPCHEQTDAAYSSKTGRLVIKALGGERFAFAEVKAKNKADGKTREAELLRMAEQALQG